MTHEQHPLLEVDNMIAILQAYKEGKALEVRIKPHLSASPPSWAPLYNGARHGWDFARYDYRIKPEPRTIWVLFHKSRGYSASTDDKRSAAKWSESIESGNMKGVYTLAEFKEVMKEE